MATRTCDKVHNVVVQLPYKIVILQGVRIDKILGSNKQVVVFTVGYGAVHKENGVHTARVA